jgi:putative hydroxymethylpyrimidine transport system substrate-binding protein
MKFCYVLAGVALAASLIGGCGGQGETATDVADRQDATQTTTAAPPPETQPEPNCPSPSEPLRMTLDARFGAENVGALMAEERGYFQDAGLEVLIGRPRTPDAPVTYVALKVDDVGLAQQPQIVFGNEIEQSVVAIGSVIGRPTAAMIWLPDSGIEDIADLKGKVIGYPGAPFQEALLKQVLAEAGLTLKDVSVLKKGYELVPQLLKGKVDAIFGGSRNIEGAALEARGVKPVITSVQELGIHPYEELEVIARAECLAKYPSMYRSFLSAMAQGTEAAASDPQEATKVIDESLEPGPEATKKVTEAQLQATLPLLSRDGHIDIRQADQLIAWMRQTGMTERKPPASKLFTDKYLPR